VLITSLGTQIHYTPQLVPDADWAEHVDHLWKPEAVRRALADLPGLTRQPKREQSRLKISYLYDASAAPSVEEIIALLRTRDLAANVVYSFGQYLDIIPIRASKGQALRFVAHRFGIPLEHILVAGGSGADEDMMRGNTLAVVVANRHHEELSQLAELERVYFASQPHAFGILEAIEHYDFFRTCRVPEIAP
jgi:sucrose-phosphate synthase